VITPLALYSDRHTIFRSPKEKLTLEQELAGETKPLSTFGKALADLGIEHVKALTPQAKGRIERLWQTFQDRFVIELRLLNVCTEEEANRVLPDLLHKHNQRFAVVPENAGSAYRPLSDARQLEYIFARREYRRISSGQTFSWDGKCYMPKPCDGWPRWEAKEIVEVRVTMDSQVLLWHQGRAWPCVEAHAPKRSSHPLKKRAEPAPPRKPAANHPWRHAFSSKQLQRNTASG